MAEVRPFEAAALGVGYALRAQGYDDLAAALLEVVPPQGIVQDEALRALIEARLRNVAAADHVPPRLREQAAEVVALSAARPRVGTVWIAWNSAGDPVPDNDGVDPPQPGYWVSWQSNDPGYSWCEDGPCFTSLRDALAWARDRADAVVVRPAWDEGTSYWAGLQPPTGRGHPVDLPPLDESRA